MTLTGTYVVAHEKLAIFSILFTPQPPALIEKSEVLTVEVLHIKELG